MENVANKMPQITEEILAKVGQGDAKKEEAIIAALASESGEKLTSDQLKILKEISDDELDKIFKESDLLKEAFGTAINFKDTFNKPEYNASDSFVKTDKFYEDKGLAVGGLTSGALMGLMDDKRLESLYGRGTDTEIQTF
jgi:hypothetical protein